MENRKGEYGNFVFSSKTAFSSKDQLDHPMCARITPSWRGLFWIEERKLANLLQFRKFCHYLLLLVICFITSLLWRTNTLYTRVWGILTFPYSPFPCNFLAMPYRRILLCYSEPYAPTNDTTFCCLQIWIFFVNDRYSATFPRKHSKKRWKWRNLMFFLNFHIPLLRFWGFQRSNGAFFTATKIVFYRATFFC